MTTDERITIDPDVRGGKPCIKGTRITVYDVLEYLAGGMTEEQILADFPSLAIEDIRAALSWALFEAASEEGVSYELSDKQVAAVKRSLAEADAGEFASDEAVKAVLAKYRASP